MAKDSPIRGAFRVRVWDHGMAVMTRRQFEQACRRLGVGKRAMARRLGVSAPTVFRWLSGEVSIPGPAAVAVRLMLKVEELTRKVEELTEKGAR